MHSIVETGCMKAKRERDEPFRRFFSSRTRRISLLDVVSCTEHPAIADLTELYPLCVAQPNIPPSPNIPSIPPPNAPNPSPMTFSANALNTIGCIGLPYISRMSLFSTAYSMLLVSWVLHILSSSLVLPGVHQEGR